MHNMMKKLMLFAALFVSMTTMAQNRETQTLTVCDGTTTSKWMPIYTGDNESQMSTAGAARTQFIIPASELASMTGGTITKIGFHLASVQTSSSNFCGGATYGIYLLEVDYTTFSASTPAGWGTNATKVYTGTLNSNNIGNITFGGTDAAESYVYQGGNLMVTITKSTISSASNNATTFYGQSTEENTSWHFLYAYYNNYTTTDVNQAYKFLPKTTFTYEQGSTYTVSVSANPTEGGTVSGSGTYVGDASCTVAATANEGYVFVNWTEAGTTVSTDAEYTFNVAANRDLVANFAEAASVTYTITATANPTAGGTVEGGGTYSHGAECTLTATANEGYAFNGWIKDGTQVSMDASYTFSVTEDAAYEAVFVHIYTIDVTVDPEDSGSIIGSGTYNEGESCELEAEPASGYTFVNWTENDEEVSTDATYSFTVTADHDFVAHFALRSYEITVAANPTDGGTVTGGGTYEHGTRVTITATADSDRGYSFVQWNKNGSYASNNASYTFTVRNAGAYEAVFTRSCAEPTGLTAADLTATSTTLSWTGEAENYNVRYRTVTVTDITGPTTEDFSSYTASSSITQYNNADKPSDWAYWSRNGYYGPIVSNNIVLNGGISAMSSQGNFLYMMSYANDCYAVMPRMDDLSAASFKYACMYESSNMGGTFYVGYVTNTSNISGSFTAFTDVSTPRTTTLTSVTLTAADINTLNNTEEARLAFYFSPGSNSIAIDDITVTYPHSIVDAGEWVYQNDVTNPASLTGLTPATLYEAQVQAACYADLQSDWSESVGFTTLTRFEKTISGYGQNEGGYYLIASPVNENIIPSEGNGFVVNAYDLYRFNQSATLEWENWEDDGNLNGFSLVSGKGYLYANSNGTTLYFDGTPYSGDGQVDLTYDGTAEFPGWNLIGNPFATSAHLDRPYYRLNPDGSALKTVTEQTEVALMEGVFVQATATETSATFVQGSKSTSVAQLNLSVSKSSGVSTGSTTTGSATIDNAIVRFDGGAMLDKFQLRNGSTKLYVPQGSKDYAVVNAQSEGEMPVNFKVEKNGTYTVGVETENIEMSYLHLIDNMTGADVDLLAEPSYTFDAKATDYESRFRLVFRANTAASEDACEPSFAFFNGSEWVVNANGDAILQVVDMMGRVVSSQTVSGNASVRTNGLSQGIYMMRLVNGNDVKVQKVIIK